MHLRSVYLQGSYLLLLLLPGGALYMGTEEDGGPPMEGGPYPDGGPAPIPGPMPCGCPGGPLGGPYCDGPGG